MYDASKLINEFHRHYIALTQEQSQDMQRRRDVNLKRLNQGLEALQKPSVIETINQGGNAMKTMTQPPENDQESLYDIDMAVVFAAEDAKTPRTTKGWVRDAITEKATNLKWPPEAKKKCVRVVYSEGYQCDFPVFRRKESGDRYEYEIAVGDEWLHSDPGSINRWFNEEARRQSPEEDKNFQLRRIVRYVKYFAKLNARKKGTKFPAGLVITALVVECYHAVAQRDDEALYLTLRALSNRFEHAPVMANGTEVSDASDVERIRRLSDACEDAVDALKDLSNSEDGISAEDACKAWKKVFGHSFFDGQDATDCLASASSSEMQKEALAAPAIHRPSDEERLRRAEAEAERVRSSGQATHSWSGS